MSLDGTCMDVPDIPANDEPFGRSTTRRDTGEPPVPDLVDRGFQPDGLDQVWCGDLPYTPPGRVGCTWPPSSLSPAGG